MRDKDNYMKYRSIRFFERRKLMRYEKVCARTHDVEGLAWVNADMMYVMKYPAGEKYVSLFGSRTVATTDSRFCRRGNKGGKDSKDCDDDFGGVVELKKYEPGDYVKMRVQATEALDRRSLANFLRVRRIALQKTAGVDGLLARFEGRQKPGGDTTLVTGENEVDCNSNRVRDKEERESRQSQKKRRIVDIKNDNNGKGLELDERKLRDIIQSNIVPSVRKSSKISGQINDASRGGKSDSDGDNDTSNNSSSLSDFEGRDLEEKITTDNVTENFADSIMLGIGKKEGYVSGKEKITKKCPPADNFDEEKDSSSDSNSSSDDSSSSSSSVGSKHTISKCPSADDASKKQENTYRNKYKDNEEDDILDDPFFSDCNTQGKDATDVFASARPHRFEREVGQRGDKSHGWATHKGGDDAQYITGKGKAWRGNNRQVGRGGRREKLAISGRGRVRHSTSTSKSSSDRGPSGIHGEEKKGNKW